MAQLSKNFISLVALGNPNPQILRPDFLKDNKIVSIDHPPFDRLLQQEKPFDEFVSTPVFTRLLLGEVEFIVDDNRFQIRDGSITNWSDTEILQIAKKYFETLPYTPLKIVGVNFNSKITFVDSREAEKFQQLFLPENTAIMGIISQKNINASAILRYPYTNNSGRVTLVIAELNKTGKQRTVNFNYEFDFTNLKEFANKLEAISEVANYADSIINQFLKLI